MLLRSLLLFLLIPLGAIAQTSATSTTEVFPRSTAISEAPTTTVKNESKTRSPKIKPLHIDYVRYEEHVYGQSKLSEIGDALELDLSVRKDFTNNTFMRLGLEIDPEENSLTKTGQSQAQRFDIFLNHKIGNFTLQAEFELNTNDKDTQDSGVDVGGINLGFDSDSEGSYISYDAFNKKLNFTFFPFNFDSEVGDEFNSWDVARLYFVEGAPSTVKGRPSEGEVIDNKTIPGLSLTWKPNEQISFNLGGGVASYLYPSNPNYAIRNEISSNSWERKQNIGAKAQISYTNSQWHSQAEYAWHENDDETGALLKAAGSLTGAVLLGNAILSTEVAMSQAGSSAYRLAKGGRWFENTEPFSPVYTSRTGQEHSWIGKTDYAYMLKAGYRVSDGFTPYAFYKFQGKNFIFREAESAHRLRTFNDDLSHGGLHRAGVGAQFQVKNFTVRPDIEFRQAKNSVFNKSAGIQDDQLNSDFRKTDFLLSLVISYQLEDNSFWGQWTNKGEGIYDEIEQQSF